VALRSKASSHPSCGRGSKNQHAARSSRALGLGDGGVYRNEPRPQGVLAHSSTHTAAQNPTTIL
jgi:hypothetical protein